MDEQMIKYNKFGWVDLSELARNKNGSINWKGSIGCKIHFKYQDVESDIILLEHMGNLSVKICILGYVDEYIITTGSIVNGNLGKATRKRTPEFRYKVGETVNGHLLLTSAYIDKCHKYYTYTCLIDGYNGHIAEYWIIRGSGCPVCSGNMVMSGVNDISTLRPDMVHLLWNLEDAYVYSPGSGKKIDFRCPHCGNKINTYIYDVSIQGLSCPKCGDGISYPEKFVFNVLQQIALLHKVDMKFQNFEMQKTFPWSKNVFHQNPKLSGNKKYDFYIPLDNGIVIETHGGQHFKDGCYRKYKNSKTLEEEQENDKLKMSLAISNGISLYNYIQLDCRYSDMSYIRSSIMSSNLPLLLNFTKNDIDWDECNKFATGSRVYETCNLWNSGVHTTKEITDIMKIHRATVSTYLRRGFELGILQDPPKYLLNLTAQNYL